MNWILAHIETIAAITVILSALWGLLLFIDRAFKKHLSDEFATKADLKSGLEEIDKKLDRIIINSQIPPNHLTLLDGEDK